MDAGRLNERVELLRLAQEGEAFFWKEAGALWAGARQQDKKTP